MVGTSKTDVLGTILLRRGLPNPSRVRYPVREKCWSVCRIICETGKPKAFEKSVMVMVFKVDVIMLIREFETLCKLAQASFTPKKLDIFEAMLGRGA